MLLSEDGGFIEASSSPDGQDDCYDHGDAPIGV